VTQTRTITTLTGTAAACLALAFAPAGAQAEKLVWSYQSDALSLDPHGTNETMTLRFLGNIYEGLVRRDKDQNLVPSLATEWEIVEPDRWRFVLRQDVTFHGGEAFSAEDVILSYERASSEGSGMSVQVAGIEMIEVVDDHTIEIVTKGPRPSLLNELANFYVVDSGWIDANAAVAVANPSAGTDGFTATHANGTGAYRVVSREQDVLTRLATNETWWDVPSGNVDEVEFRPIGNDATRMAALLSGEVDLIHPVPVQDVERLRNADGVEIIQVPEIRTIFLGFDVGSPTLSSGVDNPFADVRVRRAMQHAIDADAIRQVVMRGASRPTGIPIGPGVTGFDEEKDIRAAYDPDAAKALLEEAGLGDGFEFTLACPNDRYVNDEEICQAVVAMWAQIGIDANLDSNTKSIHFQNVQAREVDMWMQGWAPNSFDMLETFFYNFASREDLGPETVLGPGQGTWNAGSFSSPELDALLGRIAVEMDPETRAGLVADALDVFREELPAIPVHQQAIAWGVRQGVEAFPLSDDTVNLSWISVPTDTAAAK